MSPPRRGRRLLLSLPAVAYAALILFLSSQPSSVLPSTGVSGGDKALHVAEYFGFGLLLLLAVRGTGSRGLGLALSIGIAYAAFDEAYQSTVPGRIGDAADVAMDVVGVLVAVLLTLGVRAATARGQIA